MTNRRLNVLVLDDSPRTALGSLNEYLADLSGDSERIVRQSLTDPGQLDRYLDQHPEVDVVLVDVEFELTTTKTCLTAFETLIRRAGPKAIGLAASQYGRTLFPFAVCQLLPPPERQTVVGWTYKDDKHNRGYPELVRILDAIASDQGLTKPRTLEHCMPDASRLTGEFMKQILRSRSDVRLWELMSTTHYKARDLALNASIAGSAVGKNLDRYLEAIVSFETAMAEDEVHPVGAQATRSLPAAAPGEQEPRQRIVEAFAQAHRKFFQAPELEDIVVAWSLRNSRQAGRRSRRHAPEQWWKAGRP